MENVSNFSCVMFRWLYIDPPPLTVTSQQQLVTDRPRTDGMNELATSCLYHAVDINCVLKFKKYKTDVNILNA